MLTGSHWILSSGAPWRRPPAGFSPQVGQTATCGDTPGHDAYLMPCSVRTRLKSKLLAQNTFVEIMAGIEQYIERDALVHADIDAAHRAHLVVIGDRGHWPLVGVLHLDGDLALSGNSAPRQRRGRNGLIAV